MSATRFNATRELRDFWNCRHESDNHPLKSCIVFDNGASARSAIRLLKRITPDERFETTLLRLEEDLLPPNGSKTEQAAADSELLVVALAYDGEMHPFARAWFDLWISLCDDNHECALVALLSRKTPPTDFHSTWAAFLESFADTANFTFFCGHAWDCGVPEWPARLFLKRACLRHASKHWI